MKLDELYNGSVRKLAIQRHIICSACGGKGGKEVILITIINNNYNHYIIRVLLGNVQFVTDKDSRY